MMEFDLEYVDDGESKGWWCHADPQGVGAIARGDTPWLAIRAALEAFPEAIARNARVHAYLDALLAGQVRCPCGKMIEGPPPGGMTSITHCSSCIPVEFVVAESPK
jgi:hypothetical protein